MKERKERIVGDNWRRCERFSARETKNKYGSCTCRTKF